MNTLRHYFISDDLDDLERLEEQLEAGGVENPQIHVLSHDDVGVANHMHLHAVQSLLQRDLVHSLEAGAVVGLLGVVLVLGGAYLLNLPDQIIGWVPYIFLSIVVFGFCTWEGGLIGIQKPNYHYKRFEDALNEGQHVFIVELDPDQEIDLARVLKDHPKLIEKGTEVGTPHWVFAWLHWLHAFIDRNLFSSAQLRHK
jgi:hypothetical protein